MTSVKVRIAVAVNSKGEWAATGFGWSKTELSKQDALSMPIPEPVEVAGSVEG